MRGIIRPNSAVDSPWGWSHTLYLDTARRFVKCFVAEEGASDVHRHRYQIEVIIVESGVLQIFIDEDMIHLRPHETLSIPTLKKHQFRAQAETLFTSVFMGTHGHRPTDADEESFTEKGS